MRSRLSRLVPLLAALAALVGCEQNNVSLFIAGNILPEVQESGCIIDPDGTFAAPNGTFDVSTATGTPPTRSYEVYPVYVNQLYPGRNPVGADPNGIHITAVVVTLYDQGYVPLDLGGLANPFRVATSTFVPSQGRATGAVVAIPDAYWRQVRSVGLGRTIVVGIQPVARTNGGKEVETSEWYWPVDICEDCLFVCVAPGDDVTPPCNRGQDLPSPIICTTDTGGGGM